MPKLSKASMAALKKQLQSEIQNYRKRVNRAIKRYGYTTAVAPPMYKASDVFKELKTATKIKKFIKGIQKVRADTLTPVKFGQGVVPKVVAKQARKAEKRIQKVQQALQARALQKAKEIGRFPLQQNELWQDIGLRENAHPDAYLKMLKWLSTSDGIAKTERYRENYLIGISTSMIYGSLDPNNANDIMSKLLQLYKMVESMPIETFALGVLVFDTELQIDFMIYDETDLKRVDTILDRWEDVLSW